MLGEIGLSLRRAPLKTHKARLAFGATEPEQDIIATSVASSLTATEAEWAALTEMKARC